MFLGFSFLYCVSLCIVIVALCFSLCLYCNYCIVVLHLMRNKVCYQVSENVKLHIGHICPVSTVNGKDF